MGKTYIRDGIESPTPFQRKKQTRAELYAKANDFANVPIGEIVTLHDGRQAKVVHFTDAAWIERVTVPGTNPPRHYHVKHASCGRCILLDYGRCHLTACMPEKRTDGESVAFMDPAESEEPNE
jgi:hypothetical protein